MERTKLGNFDVTILDPKIIVFHNVIDDCDAFIDYYEKTLPWKGWFGFGRQVEEPGPMLVEHKTFPSYKEWKDVMISSTDNQHKKDLADVFYKASKEYFKHSGTSFPNWTCKNWSLARYIPDENVIRNENLTMNYHSDFQENKRDQPGEKFSVTAVFYPNDDYENGEISFRISTPDWQVDREFDYKPVKGDFVFFSAEHPYYHGVKRIKNKAKYISRLYWQYTSDGSPEWHALYEKYGEKFKDMEKERVGRHDLMDARPFLRPMFSISEYYERLEAGTLPLPDRHGN